MSHSEEDGWDSGAAYPTGSWGTRRPEKRRYTTLRRTLSTELLANGWDHLALRDAGRIALARQDLPVDERNDLRESVLRLALEWIGYPLSITQPAYAPEQIVSWFVRR